MGVPPLPVLEPIAVLWVAELSSRCAANTIASYLAAVSSLQVDHGLPPFHTGARIKRMLTGVRRQERPRPENFPVTPTVVLRLATHLLRVPGTTVNQEILLTMIATGVAGLLRITELTGGNDTRRIPQRCHLQEVPNGFTFHIVSSKADQQGKGTTAFIGWSVATMLLKRYLRRLPSQMSYSMDPLWRWSNGAPVDHNTFVQAVHAALAIVGVPRASFRHASFRKGGATAMAEQGVSIPILRRLGRWAPTSMMPYTYVAPTPSVLLSTASTMSASEPSM